MTVHYGISNQRIKQDPIFLDPTCDLAWNIGPHSYYDKEQLYGADKVKNTHFGLQFSPNPEGEVRTHGQGSYFDWVSPDRCF